MEDFKIKNCSGKFPFFETLDNTESKNLEKKLKIEFCDNEKVSNIILLETIKNKGLLLKETVNDNNFNLSDIIKNISSKEYVYINWYHFQDIDKIKLIDLSNNFFDIWYPSVDDIEIFDDTCKWIVSIYHYGAISIINSSN